MRGAGGGQFSQTPFLYRSHEKIPLFLRLYKFLPRDIINVQGYLVINDYLS